MSASEKQAGASVPLRTVALLAPWVDARGVACSLEGHPGKEGQLYVTGARLQLPVDMAKQIEAQRRAVWAPSPATARHPLPEFSQEQREADGTGEPMEEVEGNTLDTPINLNTATANAMAKAIKGVGAATAKDIIAHRKKQPFASLTDCAERVGGVSVEQLESADVTV